MKGRHFRLGHMSAELIGNFLDVLQGSAVNQSNSKGYVRLQLRRKQLERLAGLHFVDVRENKCDRLRLLPLE